MSFVSVLPVPAKFIPDWNSRTLRCFCPMLAVSGLIFSALWLMLWLTLTHTPTLSTTLRGFFMTLFTLGLTGGLHLDGLMDTCDALFSHRDRDTRLRILSDTHAGSFAVIGCVLLILAKTLLFAELLNLNADTLTLALIPAFSRTGMGALLNTLPFAKPDGLASMLGSARNKRDNVFFILVMILLFTFSAKTLSLTFIVCLLSWRLVCLSVFGGITGDLLGAFVELSEAVMLGGLVISSCM